MRRATLLLLAFVCIGLAHADAGGVKTGFVHKTYTGEDGDFKYAVFVPPTYKAEKEYPVILFLHGSGEVGTDGDRPTHTGLGKHIRDKKQKFGFITVFPQAHKSGWDSHKANGKAALGMLDEVLAAYKTDKTRVYLTGLSMGGFGTWHYASALPRRWAAIAPICGGGDPNHADRIKDIPCWCFHGGADPTISPSRSRDMIKALKDAGAEPRYTEYRGVGHNAWDRAYATPELYSWFLEHTAK